VVEEIDSIVPAFSWFGGDEEISSYAEEMSTIKLISQSHESDGFARRSQPLLVEIYSRRTSLRIDAAVRSCGKTTGGWRSPFAPGFG
jgi:hypothetical protein